MQKQVDDKLEIPAFLKHDSSAPKKKGASATTPVFGDIGAAIQQSLANELEAALEGLAPETATLLRSEIKSHRFQRHWLKDPSTIFVFEREHQLRKAKKEAKEEEKAVERKINKNVRASTRIEFGTGIKIIVLNRNPKRQPGAARIPRFASLLEYLDKKPEASVAEIFRETLYDKGDFMRDQRLKIIRTDLLPVVPKPVIKTIKVATKKGK